MSEDTTATIEAPAPAGSTQWLINRRRGIGGSDAPAVLGLSRWRTPLDVWLDKTGQVHHQAETEPMEWGTRLEPAIRQKYCDETGRTVVKPAEMFWHRNGIALANVDGITQCGRLYEGKTARTAEGWGEPGTDEIPTDYLIQVQHYLAVTGLEWCDAALLIGGQFFRIYEIAGDTELQELIIEKEAEWWERHVIGNEPPEPVTAADMRKRWPNSTGKAVIASEDARAALLLAVTLTETRDEIDSEIEILKAVAQKVMGESDTLTDHAGKVLATWKTAKSSERLDIDRLRKELPDVAARFTKFSDPSRRFLIKSKE